MGRETPPSIKKYTSPNAYLSFFLLLHLTRYILVTISISALVNMPKVNKGSKKYSKDITKGEILGGEEKRTRGRPRKITTTTGEKKVAQRANTPDYATAFEASKSYVTLDFMLKEHAKGVKDASKAKSDAGKLVKLWFERNPTADSLGPIECTRKAKKVVPNLDDLKQKVEDEVMQDPLRTGQLLALAITERITNESGQGEAPSQVSIKINKEAQAAVANAHQQYMHEDEDVDIDEDSEDEEKDNNDDELDAGNVEGDADEHNEDEDEDA